MQLRPWPVVFPLFVATAFGVSLLFDGFEIKYLGAAQSFLVICAIVVICKQYEHGLSLPKTPLALLITLFWLWIGVTSLWSPVPVVSILNIWWLGSLPLVFWLYVLSPEQEKIWWSTVILLLLITLGSAFYAFYQFFALHQPPRSLFLNINSHAALLNIIALPLAAYCLISYKERRRALSIILTITLFVLVYAVSLTKGRAAALALIFGMAILAFVGWRQRVKGGAAVLIGLIALALLLADYSWRGAVIERLETLSDLNAAGFTRFIIWQQAWELLKNSPWWGTGIGTFSLLFPPFRHALDSSAGFYVHNDYLQLWIEAGIPALVLLFSIYSVVLLMFLRAQKSEKLTSNIKIETAGLFAGLFVTAAHSTLDFNFYIIPILITAGLALARLHILLMQNQSRTLEFSVSRLFGARAYYMVIVLLGLFPLTYFVAMSLHEIEYQNGLNEAETGNIQGADLSFVRALQFAPLSANVLLTRADLYRHAIVGLPKTEQQKKLDLFKAADIWLKKAESINPLEPQIFSVRAQLYQDNPLYLGDHWQKQVEQSYRHALQINPRFFQGRVLYAKFLISQGQPKLAHEVLEDGMRYWYFPSETIIPYYILTAKLRFQAGEKEQTKLLQQTIEEILLANGWTRTSQPAEPKVKLIH